MRPTELDKVALASSDGPSRPLPKANASCGAGPRFRNRNCSWTAGVLMVWCCGVAVPDRDVAVRDGRIPRPPRRRPSLILKVRRTRGAKRIAILRRPSQCFQDCAPCTSLPSVQQLKMRVSKGVVGGCAFAPRRQKEPDWTHCHKVHLLHSDPTGPPPQPSLTLPKLSRNSI